MDETLEVRNPAGKKKVRVVKKIVKRTIVKKVLRRVSVASNCNDLETIASPNPSVCCAVEIEKYNVDSGGVKGESVKELEVSGMKEDSDQSRSELLDSDRNRIELRDGDWDRIELGENEQDRIALLDSDQDQNQIELQDSDQNRTELGNNGQDRITLRRDEDRAELQDGDQNGIELQDSDRSRIELGNSDQNRLALLDSDEDPTELQDSDQKAIELLDREHDTDTMNVEEHEAEEVVKEPMVNRMDSDEDPTELQDSDPNGIELLDREHDTNAMDVQEHEAEEVMKEPMVNGMDSDEDPIELQDSDQNENELVDREHDTNTMDVQEHEGEEGVKELMVKSETDGLRSQEAVIESDVPSRKMVASRLHMKKMRKIFIHGLVQETKEEDIRKVFEKVGEVVEVKIVTNFRSGKSRGFGFVTFASADLANLALTKYPNVEICGRPCHTSAIEGVDTILLDNIDKKWNNENVVELLEKIGIMKIDEVLVVPDPVNTGLNCGFAFLEFETKRDAQMAYDKLQNENVFGKHSNIKVSWASQFVDPVEEETHNMKSVYVEPIPLSWDEKEVNAHFKMFGEIESIALAKNLRTAKRNDFAFINYKTREAALSCIEALTCKKSTNNNDPKSQLKVSFAKSIPKVKPIKTISESAVTEVSKAYQKPNQSRQSQNQYPKAYQSRQSRQNLSLLGVYKPTQKLKNMIGKHDDSRKDLGSSTTAELVQLLREQASWKQGGPSSTAGMSSGHHQPTSGGKLLFTELGSKSLYHHDPRAYHQSHLQVPNVTHPRPIANTTSFPRYDQQRAQYTSGSFSVVNPDPRYFQIRDQTTYPGSSNIHRQRH